MTDAHCRNAICPSSGRPAGWCYLELIGGGKCLGERRRQRVILASNLLGTLRNRELAQVAKDIAAETDLEHRPITDG